MLVWNDSSTCTVELSAQNSAVAQILFSYSYVHQLVFFFKRQALTARNKNFLIMFLVVTIYIEIINI